MSKRSPGARAAIAKGAAIHKAEREVHRQRLHRKYEIYCDSVVADYPDGTVIPSDFEVWYRFNKVMDKGAE